MTEPVPRVQRQPGFEAHGDDNTRVDDVAENEVFAASTVGPDDAGRESSHRHPVQNDGVKGGVQNPDPEHFKVKEF